MALRYNREVVVRFLVQARNLYIFQSVQTGPPSLLRKEHRGLFLRGKEARA